MTAADEIGVIQFTISENDFADFCIFNATKSRFRRRKYLSARIGSLLLVPLAVFVLAVTSNGSAWPSIRHAIALALVAACFLALLWIVTPVTIGKAARRRFNDGTFVRLAMPRRLEISTQGIYCSGAQGESRTKWAAILEIAVTSNAIYMHLTSVQAFIVPRHAFPDDAAFDNFARKARALWSAAVASGAKDA